MNSRLYGEPSSAALYQTEQDPEREQDVVRKSKISNLSNISWSNRGKRFEAYICLVVSCCNIFRHIRALGNYGFIALLPFTLCAVFFGVPAIAVELMLGRYVSGNLLNNWNMCSFGKGQFSLSLPFVFPKNLFPWFKIRFIFVTLRKLPSVFFCFMALNMALIISNNMAFVKLLKYLGHSITGTLPWGVCNPKWAEENCYENFNLTMAVIQCVHKHPGNYCSGLDWESSARQFYRLVPESSRQVKSIGFTVFYLLIPCVGMAVINRKGIKSAEKMFKVFIYLPGFLLVFYLLGTYSITGAARGFKKACLTDFHDLVTGKMWVTAVQDTFMNYGLGTLALNFISSHSSFEEDLLLDVVIILFVDIFCFLFIAVPITTVINILEVEKKNEKLPFVDLLDVFLALTESLLIYPNPVVLWSIILLSVLALLILGSQTILYLAFCESVHEIFGDTTSYFLILSVVSGISYVLTLALYYIPHHFDIPLDSSVLTGIFLGCVTISFFYGVQRFVDDFNFLMGYMPSSLLRISAINNILVLGSSVGYKIYNKLPNYPYENIVYFFIGVPLGVYFLTIIIEMLKAKAKGTLKKVFHPNPDWGPTDPVLKKSRHIFNARTITREYMYRQELNKKPYAPKTEFSEQEVVFVHGAAENINLV